MGKVWRAREFPTFRVFETEPVEVDARGKQGQPVSLIAERRRLHSEGLEKLNGDG